MLIELEKEFLRHKNLNLEKLITYNLYSDTPSILNASIRDSINVIQAAHGESISYSYDRDDKKEDVIIVVDQKFATDIILSVLLALYYKNWKVYSIITANTMAKRCNIGNLPDNLTVLDSSEVDNFITKNKNITIKENLLFFDTRYTFELEYLKAFKQPKTKTTDAFWISHAKVARSVNLEGLENLGNIIELETGNLKQCRKYLYTFTDLQIKETK
jgi:hypothetical protein